MSTSVRANANAPNASSSAKSPNPGTAVVLSQVHVSCFITAANRATPVFEVAPERHCVRVVNKPLGDPPTISTSSTSQSNTSGVSSANGSSTSGGATGVPSAEWDFHTLFASSPSSHAGDFYREITQPAFRNVCDGWNTNIVAWGVHPTQKYRLLFGKSTGSNDSFNIQPHQQNQAQVSEKEVLELYGQLGGLLHEFFNSSSRPSSVRSQHQHSSMASQGWRIGISSWIIVSNQVIDLLKPAISPPSSSSSNARKVTSATTASSPLSFMSIEAKSFAGACRILQTAKTNRIVMKQNAEHAHFFLRLAFFHNGQVSTMHFVDLIDLKDFKEDQASIQEKQELFDIFHEIRQPPVSSRYSTIPPTVAQGLNSRPGVTNSGSTGSMSGSSTPKYKTRKMMLSNFILPLLTANAKTFLYANVIDSRTSLRESVQLLNAVANVKGFSCTCKRLCGVEFIQLGFQTPPDDDFLRQSHAPDDEEFKQNLSAQDATAKALATVAIGESLLSRLASSSSSLALPLSNSASFGSISVLPSASSFSMSTAAPPFSTPNISSILASGSSSPLASPLVSNYHHQHPGQPSQRKDSFSSVPMESETLSWLESFSQRKRDILGGKIDTIVPLPVYPTSQDMETSPAPAKSTFFNSSEGDSNDKGSFKPSRGVTFSSLDSPKTEFGFEATQMESPSIRDMVQQTSADLLQRLCAAMGSAEKSGIRRANSEPLPITDADDDTGAHNTANSRGAAANTTASTLLSTMDSSEGRITNLEDERERWSAQTPLPSQLTDRYNQRNTPDLAYPTPAPAPVLQSQPSPRFRAPTTNRMGSSNIQTDDAFASNRANYWATTSSNTVQPLDFSSTTAASKSVSFSRPPTAAPKHDAAAVPRPSPLYHQQHQEKLLHETLEKANVPSQAMAPANLDGLDVVTVTKIQATEAALLRKNYDALLTIVQEQQQLREAAEAKAAEAIHDLDEVRASFEVQIENMKLSNLALRSKVRALEKQSALPKVFDQYEQELQLLLKEVQQLRDRNVALELKMTESDGYSGPGSAHELKKKYQAVVDEKQQMEKQLLEYRKRERQFMVHSKLADDSTRRVDQLSRELTSKDEALLATKLGKLRMNAEMNQAQEEANLLHQENEKLLVEKAAATEELLTTKMYLASLENEQRKADILDRFVKKHGDRMSRLKSNSAVCNNSSSSSSSETWCRDAFAKDCEEKVFATVKRSLPQLVPLVNKLLRRLEMQELSLREYSEREIDFINLLVELVSDQPAVSLKNMIQQEMKKLT